MAQNASESAHEISLNRIQVISNILPKSCIKAEQNGVRFTVKEKAKFAISILHN